MSVQPSAKLAATVLLVAGLSLHQSFAEAGNINTGMGNTTACFPLDTLEPWNQPAPGDVHPDSVAYSTWLWNYGSDRPGNFNVSPGYSVYMSSGANTQYGAKTTYGNMNGKKLPFNDRWRPYNSDKQMIVVASDTRYTYEFYSATTDTYAKSLAAMRGDLLKVDDKSVYGHGGNPGSRGIGIPYISMLVLDCEIMAGKINHALSMRVARPKCHEAWWPATKVENHPDCIDSGMPEGARFVMHFTPARIDAWAANLRIKGGAPLESYGRALADALQVYGFFITDNGGGGASFDVQHTQSWDDKNPLKSFAVSNPSTVRDMLDGLLQAGDFSMVAEQGPRLYK
jgi:hypothetical protein